MKSGRPKIAILSLVLVLSFGGQGQPPVRTSAEVREVADTTRQLKVLVSLATRHLWVVGPDGDTLKAAPVAVGSNRTLRAGGRAWTFRTPVSIRSVVSNEIDPVWIRPDWAYVELARQKRMRLDSVSERRPRPLGNGRTLVARGSIIGIVVDSTFDPWPAEKDIIVAGVLYMPPLGTPYRAVRGTLGRYRLNLGGSIGFHGTNEPESVGRAVTHGCMRLFDADIEWLFRNVPPGTPVFIY